MPMRIYHGFAITMSTDASSACGIAGLLVELERLMLTSGTASVSMNTFLDSAPEFQAAVGAASALEAMSSRLYNDDVRPHLIDHACRSESWLTDAQAQWPSLSTEGRTFARPVLGAVLQELLKKRRFGRLTKALGDYALLAGSPADATAKYQAAADLARASSDFIWAGASLEGLAHARVSRAAIKLKPSRRNAPICRQRAPVTCTLESLESPHAGADIIMSLEQ